ncbi:DNA mismatch repair endonuclease MutL [Neiella sp. HB171785]|uniref:DNA mismatch repair protein MutL n=1 Tax=Neiella litorisoli TaxID=2771431 RepID=A0A8J6QIX5_9GAMM|nr:DNA mismatch repair endonuclease MutL [Neiella litorisoli]MBD1390024.1 DNA mismatch repair endonuclease MutL [Neiella litorisoli]
MTIEILPPRLANQIAAGEVVERPASVVKELVENSLDAEATHIEVQVERGGQKKLLIRDNGGGIDKDQLVLALSRHATSKVHSLDDIESIATLGFRGEALASISSVSRLTLTSKPAEQAEAWLAYAEGRDMQVQLRPAAHPIGTTVEVADLFFNTPARRKFLRADKTEFHHIDELIKRLALSRFDVGFALSHNGKSIRNLPRCHTDAAKLKRLQMICGAGFCRELIQIEQDAGTLKLSGWLLKPMACQVQNPSQYTFINGRMIRDKVVTHAIKQAYSNVIADTSLAGYVLYLDLPFDQVDVNVHPTKHEVRFIETRLVHDFVVQAVEQALQQTQLNVDDGPHSQQADEYIDHDTGEILAAPPAQSTPSPAPPNYANSPRPNKPHWVAERSPSKTAVDTYQALIAPVAAPANPSPTIAVESQAPQAAADHAYVLLEPNFVLLFEQQQPWLLDLRLAISELALTLIPLPWQSQPLLLPMAVSIAPEQHQRWQKCLDYAAQFGIEIALPRPNKLIVRSLPAMLRHTDLAKQLDELLQTLESNEQTTTAARLLTMDFSTSHWQSRLPQVLLSATKNMSAPYWRKVPADLLATLFN